MARRVIAAAGLDRKLFLRAEGHFQRVVMAIELEIVGDKGEIVISLGRRSNLPQTFAQVVVVPERIPAGIRGEIQKRVHLALLAGKAPASANACSEGIRIVGALADIRTELRSIKAACVQCVDEHAAADRTIHDLRKLNLQSRINESRRNEHDAALSRQRGHPVNDFLEPAKDRV